MQQPEQFDPSKMVLKERKPSLCIYHGNCADGFASAWVMRKWATEAQELLDFYPGIYQTGLPKVDLEDRDIYIVDFSYKLPELLELAAVAAKVVVIDHHKTAAEDLLSADLPNNVLVRFNMEHSGAMLTWQHFFADQEPPQLLRHIEDRDLWRFKIPGTREIQAAVFSYPYDFEIWDNLMLHTYLRDLLVEGVGIERKHHKDVAELVDVCMHWGYIAGYSVPCASLPYTLTSDAGHLMAKKYAPSRFAACYWDIEDGRVYSLRSTDEGMDVSAIAKLYGGGGHAHAAGFKIPHYKPLIVETPLV